MNFGEIFSNAKWVGPEQGCECPLMREIIEIDDEIESAGINICGLGFFELYINGVKVSGDIFAPVTSDYCERSFNINGAPFDEKLRHRTYYVNYDVSGYLRPGKNSLCVMLAPGWFGQRIWTEDNSFACYGDVRLAYLLNIETFSGKQSFASGEQVKWVQGPIISYNLFEGEIHDLTLSHDGWMDVDYDDAEFKPCRILDDMDTVYMLQDCPADTIVRHIRPKVIAQFGDKTVYDVGENITGCPVLLCDAVEGSVNVRLGEEIAPDGSLEEERIHNQHVNFRLDGKARRLRTRFTWHGFRYFEVQGPACAIDCMVIHADIPITAEFDSDNATLNWLFKAFVNTQLCNTHAGIPSDCPHIERRGYTGDGQLTCQSVMTVFGAQEFYRKWIRDIEDCQDDITGHVQYTAPYTRCGGGPGGWGCAIVHVPYAYYLQYGDAEPMQRLLPRMLKYFDFLEAHSENDLITSDTPNAWCLGDWCTPDQIAIPAPYVNNYFYIKSMLEVLSIGEVLNIHEHDALLLSRIEARTKALCDNYFDAATGDFAGNIQGANSFAVDIGLGDERTFENMVRHYEKTGCYDTGIFGTDVVTRVLFERERGQVAFDLLASEKEISYHSIMEKGATSLWEYWTGDRSHSHPMFGAVVRYLFEYLLGIGQIGAGWEHPVIAPQPVSGLNYVSGSVLTPNGRISVRMNRLDDQLVIDVHADSPENATFCMGDEEYPLTGTDTQFIAEI